MKFFWKAYVSSFLRSATLFTLISVGLTIATEGLFWEYILYKLILIPSLVLIFHLLAAWGQYFMITRWARQFGESIDLIAFAIYVMKYNLTPFESEEARRQKIENAKAVFYK